MSNIEVITSVTEMRVRIQRIIREAKECLYIISPFVRIDNEMKMLLEGKRSSNVINIRLVYGKKKSLEPETKAFLDTMPHIPKHFLKDLHAKCYLNEDMALVTSMNLYDYSMIDNVEMGVFLHNKKGFFDSNSTIDTLYRDIRSQAESIVKLSEASPDLVEAKPRRHTSKSASSAKKDASRVVSRAVPVIESGFCIRCGTGIVPDPAKPYCALHFRSWNRFKNDEYEEEHCHLCGKEHSATMVKPVCYACFKKYKDVFEFPAA